METLINDKYIDVNTIDDDDDEVNNCIAVIYNVYIRKISNIPLCCLY